MVSYLILFSPILELINKLRRVYPIETAFVKENFKPLTRDANYVKRLNGNA